MVLAILNALVAIPKIGEMVMSIVSQITIWYIARAENNSKQAIADAAAFAARASTDKERYEAAQMWHDALSRDRITQ